MSGSIADQILALQVDVINLLAQVQVDVDTGNLGPIPGLNAQILLDEQQIAALELLLCFAHGTKILTDRGEVAIENLSIGDQVVTPHAETPTMEIRWIGRQHFSGNTAKAGQPVRVLQGALGNGMPHRDLRVSGDHCLFLDGRLVPAKLLVNGVSIVAEHGNLVIDYVNIEFDHHTVVLAEGVESESYLDCGNRSRFDNATEPSAWLASRPVCDDSAWDNGSAFAAPLWGGPELDALFTRLANADETLPELARAA